MSTLAELLVRLGVDDAQFRTKMKGASKTTQQFGADIQATVGKLAGIGAAAATGVAGIALLVNQQAEAIAGYQDLSDKIGDTAENLTRLKTAADISGTAFDTIASASVKLTATLAKQDEESKGAAQAIKALGLNFDSFKAQAPVEQLGTLADAFAQFEDGAGKTAAAVQLFGKSGAEIIPFLNDLAEDTERQIQLTAEQIKGVDEYTKSVARLQSQTGTLAQQYAAELIPVLDQTLRVIKELTGGTSGLRDEAGQLAGAGTLKEWAQGAAIAIATVGESIVGVLKFLNALRGSFQVVVAEAAVAGQALQAAFYFGLDDTENAQLAAALEDRNKVLAESNARYAELWSYNGTALSDALKKQFDTLDSGIRRQRTLIETLGDVQSLLNPGAPAAGVPMLQGPLRDTVNKPTLKVPTPDTKTASALREQTTEAERFIASLRDQVVAFNQSETAAELYRLSLVKGVTPAQLAQAEALLKARDALNAQKEGDAFIAGLQQQVATLGMSSEAADLYRLSLRGVSPELIAQARALQGSIEAFQAQADAQRESAAIFEQTRTPLERYIARIRELQALLERGVANGGIDQETFDRALAQGREAFEAAERQGKDTLDTISLFSGQAARNVQDALANAIRNGVDGGVKGALASLADFLAEAAAQAAAANIAEGLFGKDNKGGGLFDKGFDFLKGLLPGAAPAGGQTGGGLSSGGGLDFGLPTGGFLSGAGGGDAAAGLSGAIGGDLLSSFEQLTAASTAFGEANASVFGSSTDLAAGLGQSLLSGPGAAFTDAAGLASQFFSSQAAGIASTTAASTAAAATTAATATATNTAIAASAAPAAALTSIASFGGAALAAAAAIPLVTTAISALVGGFAEGGAVSGPGTGTSDSILAKLSDGEFVINARAAKALGSRTLEQLNMGRLPMLALGGMVGAAPNVPAAQMDPAIDDSRAAPVVNLRVIQVASMEEAKGFLGSEEGGQAVVSQLRKNRGAVRAALGV